jgi:hypothetical protein
MKRDVGRPRFWVAMTVGIAAGAAAIVLLAG